MLGLFNVIASGASFLFGGSAKETAGTSNAMSVARGVGNFIDEQDYTAEEKAVAHAQNTANIIKAVEATREENSTRSVTRRVMAWAIMGSYLLTYWIAVVMWLVFKIDPKDLLALVAAFMLGELALAVGSFYFMVSLVRSRK